MKNNKLESDPLLEHFINEYLNLEAKIDKEIDQINKEISDFNKENETAIPKVEL